ncbi:MAG: hypothetical protein J6Y67_06500 [Lachnospiraceae bacterium]|nr:hypothetical protein [Lachnospiraceae bacterium]
MGMSSADLIGCWKVAKARSFVGGKFDFFTLDEVKAELEAKQAAGELDGDPAEMMQGFNTRVEFTEDGKVLNWMKAPEGVSEEEIQAALASGELTAWKDGMMCLEAKEWKEEDGKILYNSGEYREIFGEVKSPWDELSLNDEGLLPFGSGMVLLRKC